MIGAIVVYLAMFYRRHQMLRRIGYFYCAAPLSGAFGGLLATGLAKIEYGGYKRWPWIFFSTLDKYIHTLGIVKRRQRRRKKERLKGGYASMRMADTHILQSRES